ncbi:hypothetical protein D3C72_2173540 [compost metagenome]
MGRDQHRDASQLRDRREVLFYVIGLRAHEHRCGHEGRCLHEQGISVWRRGRHKLAAERSAGTRPVIDNEFLAEIFAQALRNNPCDSVHRSAGGIRDYDSYRLVGEGLSER